jgi:opacity protein-like surface antigen
MRTLTLFVLVIGTTAASAFAQGTWDVIGSYQYTRVDQSETAAESKQFTETTGLPTANPASSVNASGFSFGLQNNINSWFGGILTVGGAYPNVNTNITALELASGATPATPNSTYIAKTNEQVYTFLFGPQFTLRPRNRNFQPFVRVLFGMANAQNRITTLEDGVKFGNDVSSSATTFAFGGGGGVDFHVKENFWIRAAADFVRTSVNSGLQENLAVSVGLDYRIGER